jgi:formamidopyrimidine-DNA glycosylase
MPELPEVQSVVTTLAPLATGAQIVRVPHIRADMVTPTGFDLAAAIAERSIRRISRRGKRIVFWLDDGNRFYIHLGMTGRLTHERPSDPIKKHTHFIADLSTGGQLRLVDPRRFGALVWLGAARDTAIGPEPLSLRPSELAKRLSRTQRAVKAALLDQVLIAGLGNIYVDESLHLAGIHPLTPANQIDRDAVGRLNRAIKRVLRHAIRSGGSSIRDYVNALGEKGGFQKSHRVYDRAGQPCKKCKVPIVRIIVGGRSTHFCTDCQCPASSEGK